MPKKIKPCSQCAELASERDSLLSYRELYEKTQKQNQELNQALKRAWKLIDQLTPELKAHDKNW